MNIVPVWLTPDNVPELVELENLCFASPWSEEALRSELTREITFSPGLLVDNSLKAYSINYLVADELHILNVGVHPDLRRMGLGAKLVDYLLAEAKKRGVESAYLEVRVTNKAAQALYEKLGFQVARVRQQYYGDTGEDALELTKIF